MLERERESRSGGRGRGASRLPSEQGARCGAPSQDPEIMTWAQGRRLTNWATQAPLITNNFVNRDHCQAVCLSAVPPLHRPMHFGPNFMLNLDPVFPKHVFLFLMFFYYIMLVTIQYIPGFWCKVRWFISCVYLTMFLIRPTRKAGSFSENHAFKQ